MHALQKFLIFPDRHLVVEEDEQSGREMKLSCHLLFKQTSQFESAFTECSNSCVIRQTPPHFPNLVLHCKRTPLRKLFNKATQTR